MLTKEYILKIARLRDQNGDPRPGFLHDGKSNLKGPYEVMEPECKTPIKKQLTKRSKSLNKPKYRLVQKVDIETGDLRLIQEIINNG